MNFEEVEQLQIDIRNENYDTDKLLTALEDYKWLLEFKPFEELVNTQPISTETLYDASRAYSRWYSYTQCDMGLQKILFFDGWHKELEDCRNFRIPFLNGQKYGLGFDEDAWAKASEDMWDKELEEYHENIVDMH